MDWYYGSGVNDYLVPKDQDLLDRHPSPDCWSNWGISATEDQSSSSSVCGGLPEQSFQQTALSCDQHNYQLQDLPRFEPMNDIFLDPTPEDLPCVDDENLDKSTNISPEHQCSGAPGILQKDIAASKYVSCSSESKDCPDTKALPVNILDSFEQSSNDDGMSEKSSLEEFILKDLEMIIGQFTERNRICFRDALYRLARNTEQQDVALDQHGDLNMPKAMPHMDHNEIVRSQHKKPMESETNSVDRVIANLMFNNMEFNIHSPLTSSINSMQQVIGSKCGNEESSKALNMGQKFHYPQPQKLPADAEVPRFGQLRDTGSHIACEDPTRKSFMIGFG
ncbi:protein LNK3-like isoform X2 [Abrus precatorius]|uniref:Protein LNK3-like isoform X2 n=1 Tax=Abrus precatorius TaxID=3816 RepID=A0A8B8KFH3_ABRPR|nr:protein LNK3-like isoform X2 [Abrus precatorius]